MRRAIKYQIRETIVTVTAEEKFHDICLESIKRNRSLLERHIIKDPFFKVTLEPYRCDPDSPAIIRRMVESSLKAGVGPMAAVAGTIAWTALEDMVKAGCTYGIIDNGGDIAMINDETVIAGIYAGQSPIKGLGLKIPARDSILGICTSAGTVGPSISFGNADAAMVISEDVSLADACATALGNRITDQDSLAGAFDFLSEIHDVIGALGIIGDKMATYRTLPEIIRANVDYEKITRGY